MIYETLNKFIVDMEAIEKEILNNTKPTMEKLIRESNSAVSDAFKPVKQVGDQSDLYARR